MPTNTNAALRVALARLVEMIDAYTQSPVMAALQEHITMRQARAVLASAAQPPADGALNTIAAMFHSGEEIEGPDGLAMMVDMALWNDALASFEGIIGDEMEPAKEQA